MKISEIAPDVLEESLVWGRSGTKLKKKFRCTSGSRKGRVVSKPEQCNLPRDVGKSIVLKKTKSKFGSKLAKRAKKTKRKNPASRKLVILNKRGRR